MNILHLSTEKTWRGGENQLAHLIQATSVDRFRHHVVLQPGSVSAERFRPFAKIHSIRMRNDLDVVAAYKIAVIASAHGIDIMHAHTARGHMLGLLAKKLLRSFLRGQTKSPKLVVHRRVEQRGRLSVIEKQKYLSREIDAYICVSQAVASGLRESGVKRDLIHVVHSAVASTPSSTHVADRIAARREFGWSESDLVVCCVAAMEESKGIPYLMAAWEELMNRQLTNPPKLLMVGEGDLRSTLEAAASATNVGDIVFTGFRTDVRALMAASDVLVLPTLWEGLGTVLLDGILSGCAVVASNVGGVPEIVQHDKTGLLVPPRNAQALAGAIARLLADSGLRDRLVTAGRQHIAAQFSLEKLVRDTTEVYRSLLLLHS